MKVYLEDMIDMKVYLEDFIRKKENCKYVPSSEVPGMGAKYRYPRASVQYQRIVCSGTGTRASFFSLTKLMKLKNLWRQKLMHLLPIFQ